MDTELTHVDENTALQLLQEYAREKTPANKNAFVDYIMPWVEQTRERLVNATDEHWQPDPHATRDIAADTLLKQIGELDTPPASWKAFADEYRQSVFQQLSAMEKQHAEQDEPAIDADHHSEHSSLQFDPKRDELLQHVAAVVETLEPRDQKILDGAMRGESGATIGKVVGVSRNRIGQRQDFISARLKRGVTKVMEERWYENSDHAQREVDFSAISKKLDAQLEEMKKLFPATYSIPEIRELSRKADVSESTGRLLMWSDDSKNAPITDLEKLFKDPGKIEKLLQHADPQHAEEKSEALMFQMGKMQRSYAELQAQWARSFESKTRDGNILANLKETAPERSR